MLDWKWLVIIGGVVALVIALIFEDSREWIMESVEGLWDVITSMFDDVGDFSIYGLIFGLMAIGIIFYLRNQLLMPFLKYYKTAGKIFWGGNNLHWNIYHSLLCRKGF